MNQSDDDSSTFDLKSFANDQLQTKLKIITVMLCDGFLFLVWIGVAWAIHEVADYVKSKGVSEVFADIFNWAASMTILAFALMHMASDLRKEWNKLFGNQTE